MARRRLTRPRVKVYKVCEGDVVVAYRWKVSYPYGVETRTKSGKVSVARFDHLSPGEARLRTHAQADDDARGFAASLAPRATSSAPEVPSYTVRQWFDYCDQHVWPQRGNVARYRINRRASAEIYFLPQFGHMPIGDLASMSFVMAEWFRWLGATTFTRTYKRKKGEPKKVDYKLGHHSQLNVLSDVRGYLTWAKRHGLLAHNPMEACVPNKVGAKRYAANVKANRKFLSVAEVNRFFAMAKEHEAYVAYLIVRDTGCRVSEACGVRVEDVDLSTGSVDLTVQLSRLVGHGLVESDEMKSENGKRPALCSPELLEIVRRRVMAGRSKYVAIRESTGEPLDSGWVSKQFRLISESAGIELPKGNSTHALRRTVLDAMRQSGVSDQTRKLLGGHGVEVANLHYADLDDEQRKELHRASEYWLRKLGDN